MSCIVTCSSIDGRTRNVMRRGSEPRKPATWDVKAWLILPSGEKHTHSTRVSGHTALSLVPIMGALIDSLIADNGNTVSSAGWTATSHGARKKR